MEDSDQAEPYPRSLGGEASYWTLGSLMTWLAEGKDTDGAYALAEQLTPRGVEPPPHTHHREDEAYYVLEGEMSFRIGGQSIEASAGEWVYMPRGVEHSFQVKTSTAKALLVVTPAGIEEAFRRISEPARSPTLPPPPEGPPDLSAMVTVLQEYGVELSPPPK